jgi:hypothetical protein
LVANDPDAEASAIADELDKQADKTIAMPRVTRRKPRSFASAPTARISAQRC